MAHEAETTIPEVDRSFEFMPDTALSQITSVEGAMSYLIDSADELRAVYPEALDTRDEDFDYLDWIGSIMIELSTHLPPPKERGYVFARWTAAYALATVQLS